MEEGGKILEGKEEPSVERELHLEIYKQFKDTKVVLHAHPSFTTAFFNYFDRLDIFSFEAKFYLGEVKAIAQDTPTVTNIEPVLEALENANIVVLKNHGVVAVGDDFKAAFSLIELLEEQARVNLLMKSANLQTPDQKQKTIEEAKANTKKYKMLSEEHAGALMGIVNNDSEAQELGRKYDLTCTLAVKNQDNGEVIRFVYEHGKIMKIDNDENAEFVIIGKPEILRKVFNREIDPFVASTQGKVKTKGDFAKMSKWYPVMVRTFKLWEQAPVE
jgi:ribulose-5-phosphate 4-epimerase/fuculose-1-phosphate aldolase